MNKIGQGNNTRSQEEKDLLVLLEREQSRSGCHAVTVNDSCGSCCDLVEISWVGLAEKWNFFMHLHFNALRIIACSVKKFIYDWSYIILISK